MCMVIQIAIFLDTIKRTKYRNIFCQTNQTHTLSTRVHYIYISDVKMASPLSEKVQLCPHCNKFLSSRTVLRHRKLYGKSKRRAWRPALHVPSIGARKSLNVRLLISNKIIHIWFNVIRTISLKEYNTYFRDILGSC